MVEQRQGGAKSALRQQEAELKRTARGKHFVGEDTGSARGRAAERAKVHRMQVRAREEAQRAAVEQEARRQHEELLRRPLWQNLAGLVLDTVKLTGTLARLPFRAAMLPFRVAGALLSPRWGQA
jgi:hypothetical protein